jgi:hypothetical protein
VRGLPALCRKIDAPSSFPLNHSVTVAHPSFRRSIIENAAHEVHQMATTSDEMKIVLQVGTELRVTNKGEVILSNPELELSGEERAADAVLLYKFNPSTAEHTFRLVDPLADRKHTKVHRPGD